MSKKSKTKVLGYGYKLVNETLEESLGAYPYGFCPTLDKAKADILKGKADGNIPKAAKPQIFKVTVTME